MSQEQKQSPQFTFTLPTQFITCPITHEIYVDPVMLDDGIIYERKAAIKWFEENSEPPVIGPSGKELKNKEMVANIGLRDAISSFPQAAAKWQQELEKLQKMQEELQNFNQQFAQEMGGANGESKEKVISEEKLPHPLEEKILFFQKVEPLNTFLQKIKASCEALEQIVPEGFLCPITHLPMENPQVLPDGHSFEKTAIEAWINEKNPGATSPLTRLSITHDALKANPCLQLVIKEVSLQLQSAKASQLKVIDELLDKIHANYLLKNNALFRAGEKYYQLFQYRAALPLLLEVAKIPHPRAYAYLGTIYTVAGFGVRQHLPTARYYYSLAREIAHFISTAAPTLQQFTSTDAPMLKQLFIAHATMGDPAAQTEWAIYAEFKDPKLAVEKYRLACEQNHPGALNRLAWCHRYGTGGTEINLETATKLWRRAAKAGHSVAQNELGECYEEGQGVTKNLKRAVSWYRKAAKLDNANAQKNLARCLEKGIGTTQNLIEAVQWYERAALQIPLSTVADQAWLPAILRYYHLSCGSLEPEWDLLENHRSLLSRIPVNEEKALSIKANELLQSAVAGDAIAQCLLADHYLAARDYSQAISWYAKAAEQGNSAAKKMYAIVLASQHELTQELEFKQFLALLTQFPLVVQQLIFAYCCSEEQGTAIISPFEKGGLRGI